MLLIIPSAYNMKPNNSVNISTIIFWGFINPCSDTHQISQKRLNKINVILCITHHAQWEIWHILRFFEIEFKSYSEYFLNLKSKIFTGSDNKFPISFYEFFIRTNLEWFFLLGFLHSVFFIQKKWIWLKTSCKVVKTEYILIIHLFLFDIRLSVPKVLTFTILQALRKDTII